MGTAFQVTKVMCLPAGAKVLRSENEQTFKTDHVGHDKADDFGQRYRTVG